MPPLQVAVHFGVYLVMALTVLAALGVVLLPNLFHAALALAGTLLGIAGIYAALGADFLAAVQILIYVGAVMTLVIFAVMLTQRFGDKTIAHKNHLGLPAFAGAIVFLAALSRVILATPWPQKAPGAQRVTAAMLGHSLMKEFIFPFEVISVILIAALVGALVVAKRTKE